jgi:uncharacterized protein YjaG (DUF416 family)
MSRDPLSKVIVSRSACEKHDLPRTWTFRGIQIDFNEQLEKHDSSICISRDSRSNVTASSALQPEKHDFARVWTFCGIQINFNEQLEKHDSSIRVSRN